MARRSQVQILPLALIMAESTLSLTFAQLKSSAGLFLGFGRGLAAGDPAWNTRQSALLDGLVAGGLRQFYYPPPIDKGGVSYEWSFLRPSTTIALASGAQSVTLPDDFGGFDGPLSVQAATAEVGIPVEQTGMGRVRQMRAEFPTATGRPLWAAVDPVKRTDELAGQRFTLEVYPLADQDYTLSCAYYVRPDMLSGTAAYAYGGPEHAETIEASIQAQAELKLDDVAQGPRWGYFMQRLAVSVSQDRKVKAQLLGFNRDRSNALYGRRHDPRRSWYRGGVTVNGEVVS